MATRNNGAKQKMLQTSLRGLCVTVIEQLKKVDFENDTHKVTALYSKLSEYRSRLREVDQEVLQQATDFPKEYPETESFDRKHLEFLQLEMLFLYIPDDPPLRTSRQPLHLRHLGCGDQGNGPASVSKGKGGLAKLKLEVFDGRSQSWPLWKMIFENEVHENAELSSEHKFSYLMSGLKKGSFAFKLSNKCD